MSGNVSRELVHIDGRGTFIIEGNPTDGYAVEQVVHQRHVGHFRRKWQAVEAAREADLTEGRLA